MDSEDDEDFYTAHTSETTPLKARNPDNCCGVTPWLLLTTLVCIFGSSFQFGYNLAVINAPEEIIRHHFESHNVTMSNFMWSTTVSITAIGGLMGALVGPTAADMFGRKSALLWNNVVIIVGCVFMFLSKTATSPAMLIIGRFIVGINNGINTVIVPMFLSEISPTHIRGILGTSNQFGIVIGMLVAYVLGLKQIMGTATGWPYLLAFSTVIAVIQVFILPFCPSSPRYLLIKLNKESLARQELRKLQGSYNIEQVITEMKREKEGEEAKNSLSILQLLGSKSLRFSLVISLMLQLSQQLSGINSIFYYSTSTFEKAGISDPDAATCGLGVTSVLMVGLALILVERLGRRTLMLVGLAGMFVFYGLITLGFALKDEDHNLKYLSLVCTFLLLAFFQIGPGPIPWFMMSELFAQGPRPAATSISGAVNWFANFIVGVSFPTIQSLLYPYVFVVYMVLIIGFWFFIYFCVPETKGKTFDQISKEIQRSFEHSINSEEPSRET